MVKFKINPDKNYDVSYNVINSRTIETIDIKNYEGYFSSAKPSEWDNKLPHLAQYCTF